MPSPDGHAVSARGSSYESQRCERWGRISWVELNGICDSGVVTIDSFLAILLTSLGSEYARTSVCRFHWVIVTDSLS